MTIAQAKRARKKCKVRYGNKGKVTLAEARNRVARLQARKDAIAQRS